MWYAAPFRNLGRPSMVAMIVTVLAFTAIAALAWQSPPPGISRVTLFDNDRATVARVTFAPGAREESHTHPVDILVIQDTAGDRQLIMNGKTTTSRQEHGTVVHIPKETPHAAANVGTIPFDLIVVTLK